MDTIIKISTTSSIGTARTVKGGHMVVGGITTIVETVGSEGIEGSVGSEAKEERGARGVRETIIASTENRENREIEETVAIEREEEMKRGKDGRIVLREMRGAEEDEVEAMDMVTISVNLPTAKGAVGGTGKEEMGMAGAGEGRTKHKDKGRVIYSIVSPQSKHHSTSKHPSTASLARKGGATFAFVSTRSPRVLP